MTVKTRPDPRLSTPTTTGNDPRRSPTAVEPRSAEQPVRETEKETTRRELQLARAHRRQAALRALEERDLAFQRALIRSGVPMR